MGPGVEVGAASAGGTAQWPVAAHDSTTIDIVMEVGQTSTEAPLKDAGDGKDVLDACNATIGKFQAAFAAAAHRREVKAQNFEKQGRNISAR